MDKKQNSNDSFINTKDNKCFQDAVAVTLNYEEIKKEKYRHGITKTNSFTNKYNWEGFHSFVVESKLQLHKRACM